MIQPTLKAPFPYFGGKSRVAAEVWRRFGSVRNYVEPFFGSGAVLLGRPDWHPNMTETVNDLDGLLCNFWRALQADPEGVAAAADWPVSECDLIARNRYLISQREHVTAQLKADAGWYDAKLAGWWVWGASCWIGGGWCRKNSAKQMPTLKNPASSGIHTMRAALPCLHGDSGASGRGVHSKSIRFNIPDSLRELSCRLRMVRLTCGDFERVLTFSVTQAHGVTAVFLDPPYDAGNDDPYAYDGRGVAQRVAEWAQCNGDNPMLRIALCGYDGEHDLPGWTVHAWKTGGGYARNANGRGRANAARERIWFNPHCLDAVQSVLFEDAG